MPASAVNKTLGRASSMRIASEHRERRFRDHRHVDQHAVASADTVRAQDRRAAIHFGVELGERVARVGARLGREIHERRLIGAFCQMPIDGVVTEVRAAADKPPRKGRLRIIEDAIERRLPIDQRSFRPPERLTIGDGTAVEITIGGHDCHPERWRRPVGVFCATSSFLVASRLEMTVVTET